MNHAHSSDKDPHAADKLEIPETENEILKMALFLEDFNAELEDALELNVPNSYFNMALHLIRCHFEAKLITPSSLVAASKVPYATATRKLKEMIDTGLVVQRPRTASGKSYSVHPSQKLIEQWMRLTERLRRIAEQRKFPFSQFERKNDYYYGDSYLSGQTIPPLKVLPTPLKIHGGVHVLVHGDPTFMVMDNLKRQFEQVIGNKIHQRVYSIDRLREEVIKNSKRSSSRYDIIAIDLPWIGEFASSGILFPLDEIMDVGRLDPADFHTAGWSAAHWGGRPYAVPAQTTPELLFYRRDLFAEAGLEPPVTTTDLLAAAKTFHEPQKGRYGIAWNAARGTALGHEFLMTLADFGQPILNLNRIAGGFDTSDLAKQTYEASLQTDSALQAAEFLLELLNYSPPNILSMSWYERVRPYSAGSVAMAYGYTLLAPYFELDQSSPACGQTGYVPHPTGANAPRIAPVGGYVLGIPSNLPEDRISDAVEALIVFTSPQAQKMYVQNGSRTNPRYSVGEDPEVRRTSTIFEAIDEMSLNDELQYWPRPPIPEINDIIQICGEEIHEMLRGIVTPKAALTKAQSRIEAILKPKKSH